MPAAEFVAGGREVFRPDVVGWRKKRLATQPPGRRASIVPDWLCEIISPASRAHDMVTKREAFARIGVRYRWNIDLDTRTLHAFELKRGQWIETCVFCDDDDVHAEPFAEVGIPLATWWDPPAPTATKRKLSRVRKRS